MSDVQAPAVACPIEVSGYTIEELLANRGEGIEALRDARLAIIRGGRSLLTRYIGMKRYDGFYQREDHTYGYGPKHGSIVWRVGLTREVRERFYADPDATLTEDEQEVALALLGTADLDKVRARMLGEEERAFSYGQSNVASYLDRLFTEPGENDQANRQRLDEAIRYCLARKAMIRMLREAGA